MSDPDRPRPQGARAPDLRPLLDPGAIAILGASDDPTRIGGRPLRYMLEAGFARPIYPVNPNRATVQGLKCYATIADVPGPVDCALVALPAEIVVEAVEACAAKGVKSTVVFSSGFAETDAEGAARQARLAEVVRRTGIRVVGPNCLGIFNAGIGFYATFSSSLDAGPPPPGNIAIVSQSGAYGSHVFALARAKRLGVRYWITTGNECDVEIAEGIAWAALAEDVAVIVAYAEGVRDGAGLRHSLDLARAAGKPVIFMKVGRSEIGAAAAASHTAALAGSDAIYDAVFRQHGAYRADSTEAMLDVAYACTAGIYPKGRRIGLVTISGGVGVQMADAASDLGLDVAAMPEAAQARLKEMLPYAAPRNPVDITAQAFNDLTLVSRNLELMLEEGGYDVIVAFFTMVAASPYIVDDLLAALGELRRRYPERLIVLSLVAPPDIVQRYEDAGFLVFEDPGRAIAAVAALADFGRSFARGPADPPPTLAADAIAIPDERLSEHESKTILAAAGLPVVEERLVRSVEAAAEAAEKIGPPVAMKLNSRDIGHKTEIGGVLLNVASPEAARQGYETLLARAAEAAPGALVDGVLMAPMVRDGVETILGVQHDPVFGPAVMFGLGGIFAEALGDVVFRIAPFGEDEAWRMIREIAGYRVLEGLRGRPRADQEALARALAALSGFAAAAADRIESVDVNPFLVRPEGEGAVAVDALIVPCKKELSP
ncbi:MAG: acetate--CoA ligase family protein [Rhodospirillales bacterium]|nr:acetate--CoA ligase family protein [Rhodospirillales bacterium]MDH3967657.1 acetate--CoA ligase family protein [Rhodospirillales bacterium]